jgi:large repetitive protein
MKTCAARLLAVVGAMLAAPTYAATFAVNSVNDAVDAMPGDGICRTRSGVCTLRAAVQEANALAGADSITLLAGQFLLTVGGRDEDAAATGDLDVTDDLTISGIAADSTIISGYSSDRVFEVHAPAALTLSNLTIADGLPAAEEPGGGLLNKGTLTLTNVTFSGNRAGRGTDINGAAGDGGGLENLDTATLTHVTFTRNHAGNAGPGDEAGWGGGLRNLGTATLSDVAFNSNEAGAGDPIPYTTHSGGSGGGMANDGTATLTNVSFSGNRAGTAGFDGAGGWGGGMINQGTVTLSNVGFTDNWAGDGGSNDEEDGGDAGNGGGLENYEGTATLTNVSFSQNHAGTAGVGTRGSAAAGGSGGGMDNEGAATLNNVTFDHNRAGDGNGDVGGGGGGLSNFGHATLTNVTVFANQAGNGNGTEARGGDGGGIANLSMALLTNVTIALNSAGSGTFGGTAGVGNELAAYGSMTVTNTIVSGVGEGCSTDGAADNIVSLGHNLDSGSTCGFADASDRSGTDPVLGPLANHGGFTETLALLPGSPAIDAGDNTSCPSTDQRGVPRPQGAACDIGAYESQAPTGTATDTPIPTVAVTPTSAPSITPTATQTSAHTDTPTELPSPIMTATPEETPTETTTFTPNSATCTPTTAATTPTPTRTQCVGDCDSNGKVTIDELLTMVRMALDSEATQDCIAGDVNRDGAISIAEILAAVNRALSGCGGT